MNYELEAMKLIEKSDAIPENDQHISDFFVEQAKVMATLHLAQTIENSIHYIIEEAKKADDQS